jgi:hypothetical protein
MEVHAHTHPASAGTRKKWTHYLWEFLMLFLAVFCGFLAEYQLEHMIEKNREKQYMLTLKEDLVADTSAINNSLDFWQVIVDQIDTVRPLLRSPVQKENILKAYLLASTLMNSEEFLYRDRTIEQLKNSGNFRLIHKKNIAQALIQYDGYIRNQLRAQEKLSKDILMDIMALQGQLFDSELVERIYFSKHRRSDPLDPAWQKSLLLPANSTLLFRYYNQLYLYKSMVAYIIRNEKGIKNRAKELLVLLDKEYRLK